MMSPEAQAFHDRPVAPRHAAFMRRAQEAKARRAIIAMRSKLAAEGKALVAQADGRGDHIERPLAEVEDLAAYMAGEPTWDSR